MAKSRKRGQNEGSIFQRQDGRWCGILSLGWEGGRRRRKSFYGQTAAEVQEQMLRARADQSNGLPIAPERQTVAQYLDRWLESLKPTVRPLTHKQYVQYAKLYLKPAIGRVQLAKLRPQHVQAFVNAMLKRSVAVRRSKKRAVLPAVRTLSPRTVQLALTILRHALDQATKWGDVARNVAKLVDGPRVERSEIKPLDSDQARTFLEAASGRRWGSLYATTLILGLREGEALGLRWADVDLEAGTLKVNQTAQRTSEGRVFSPPKTDRSRRTLSLPDSLVKSLKRHHLRQLQDRLAAGSAWRNLDLVFTTRNGTAIEAGNLWRDFKKLLKAAGLPDVRFHDLRHSAASLLLSKEAHPRAIMEFLGHSRISVTMDTYAHVMPAMMRDLASKMDAIVGGN